jgi:hypothetical protein
MQARGLMENLGGGAACKVAGTAFAAIDHGDHFRFAS